MQGSKAVTKEDVLKALSTVHDPELHRDLVSLGMVEGIEVDGSTVSFSIVLTTPACPLKRQIENSAREAVAAIPGVEDVRIRLTSRVQTSRSKSGEMIPGVRNIVAVGSGKGGVGKSTVSVGLALALAETGAKVGLLDADIWGPNIPQMLEIQAPPRAEEKRIIPAVGHGIKVISMDFFVNADTPIVWRGPLVGKMVQQFLSDVDWGDLDYLVVDLPPGTGDASLSLAQTIPLTGLVVVVTPQGVALADAVKAISMFKRLDVPILGVVENMSYFLCPHCSERTDIFGHGGAKEMADELEIPFLGEIPMDPVIRAGGDVGQPVLVIDPESTLSQSFRDIAGQVAARISLENLKQEEKEKQEDEKGGIEFITPKG
ncbi:MAG: Mrp/NBP35 family ATP-binding protein [Chloroflexota bacterium]